MEAELDKYLNVILRDYLKYPEIYNILTIPPNVIRLLPDMLSKESLINQLKNSREIHNQFEEQIRIYLKDPEAIIDVEPAGVRILYKKM